MCAPFSSIRKDIFSPEETLILGLIKGGITKEQYEE